MPYVLRLKTLYVLRRSSPLSQGYPVFTQGDTSSIGIDELQLLLLKNALLLGVDFQLGMSCLRVETALKRLQK